MDVGNKYNKTGISGTQPLGSVSPLSNPGLVPQPANLPSNPGALKVGTQTLQNGVYPVPNGGEVVIGNQTTSPSTIEGEAGIAIYDGQGGKLVSLTQGQPTALIITTQPLTTTPQRETIIPLVQISDNSLEEDAALSINNTAASDGLIITQQPTPVWGSANSYFNGELVSYSGTFYNSLIDNNINFNPSTSPNAWLNSGLSAVSGVPLQILNSVITSGSFTHVISFENSNGNMNSIWVSNGTTPNGHLSGQQGDLCLNGPSGVPYYCNANGVFWINL